jgi:hypothetical protein
LRSGLKAQVHGDAAELGTVAGRHHNGLGRADGYAGAAVQQWPALGEFRGDVGGVGGLSTGTETGRRLARAFAYVDARTVDVDAHCDESITGAHGARA